MTSFTQFLPTSLSTTTSSIDSTQGPKGRTRVHRIAEASLVLLLFVVPALMAAHMAVVGDPDLWWHLRTGEWILQHRAIPSTDPFSRFGAGKPWAPYSWLFEILIFSLFQRFGLVGVVLYTSMMLMGITIAVHQMVRDRLRNTSFSVLLTFAICFSLGHMYTPRPWLLTILFFTLELAILMQARHTRDIRPLAWLPLVFLVWTNVHIQFVDGLLVLMLACTEAIRGRLRPSTEFHLELKPILVTTFFCVAATFCNPFGWRIYEVARDLASQPGVLNRLQELQAMPFRNLVDWCVLALGIAATITLARKRRFVFFETALLAFAAILAFRSQRDVWILAISAGAVLSSQTSFQRQTSPIRPYLLPVQAILASVLSIFGFLPLSTNNRLLSHQLQADLPVQAVDFVRMHGYAGPVYNDYAWGGYLIWSLRQPVSIDGRAALHGDYRITRSDETWGGSPAWANDPELLSSTFVLGPSHAALSQLLRLDHRFRLVYEDHLAVVFVRSRSSAAAL